jgi:hypothetical protein
MGTVQGLAKAEGDLAGLMPDLYRNPRKKLATMVACLVETRSCNTMELAAKLPIKTERAESRYAWIERFLSAETIDDVAAMKAMTRRLLATLSEPGRTIVVSIDQTALDAGRAIGMMSARVGKRALPLFWIVKSAAGNIPIKDYLPMLKRLKACVPEGAEVMVLADRFFATPDLIKACQTHRFRYRLRLKSNLRLTHQDGELRVDEMPRLGLKGVVDAELCNSGLTTNIGYVHDQGHRGVVYCDGRRPDPHDHARLWFALEHRADVFRLQIAGLPLSGHPSAAHGSYLAHAACADHCLDLGNDQRPSRSKKLPFMGSLKQLARSALSFCKQGLRHLARCAQLGNIPAPLNGTFY